MLQRIQLLSAPVRVFLPQVQKLHQRPARTVPVIRLQKKVGHHIVKPLPALVQLTSDNPLCKSMAGVRSTGNVTIFANGSRIASDTGEIQYTDYGISGIPVFQVSRYAVKAVDVKKNM